MCKGRCTSCTLLFMQLLCLFLVVLSTLDEGTEQIITVVCRHIIIVTSLRAM